MLSSTETVAVTAGKADAPAVDLGWVLGLATLVVTPYAYSFFVTLGGPFDAVFVPNFYHLPLEDRLRPLALLCALPLTAGIFLFGLRMLAAATGRAFAHIRLAISVLAILFALNFLRSGVFFWAPLQEIMGGLREHPVPAAGVGLAAVAIAGFLLYRFRGAIDAICTGLIRAYALVALVVVFNAGAAVVQLWPHLHLHVPLAAERAAAPDRDDSRQFVWMIFDQADQKMIYENRDPSLELPNFDRLRQQSIAATNAWSPGIPTFIAIPSLMLGELVEVRKGTPDSPEVKFDGSFSLLSEAPTILRAAHRSDIDVGIVAQTFDMGAICRAFASSLNYCWQENAQRGEVINLPGQLLRETVVVWKRFLFAMPLLRLATPGFFDDMAGIGVIAPGYIAETLANTEKVVAGQLAAGLSRDRLLYVHWMLPHQPYIYDRFENEIVEPLSGSDLEGYKGNLELADRVLGRILDTLEQSGASERTALLVTADHGFDELHVPFLLKLPGPSDQAEIVEKFDTKATRRLIDAFFARKLGSVDDVRTIVLQ